MHPSDEPTARSFQTTRWSLVLATARDDQRHRRALQELCSLYWPAVYALFRRSGHDQEAAADLTQGLFLDLIERDDFTRADPARGRFRAYLRSCARHFASNHLRNARAEKRGRGKQPVSLDLGDAESTLGPEPADRETPDLAFDRRFARTLLQTVLDQVAAEYAARGRSELFGALRCYLEVGGGPGFDASAAALGLSEGSVRVAVHRMRKRFRELLVSEVRQTLAEPDDAGDEIEQLLAALRRPRTDFPQNL